MKPSTIFTAIALVATSELVSARNCKTGLNYCGRLLLSIGNYEQQVHQALVDSGQPTDKKHIDDALFHCDGGKNGDIHFLMFCGENRCVDGGTDRNDYCPSSRLFRE
ncbi:hypothetical protein K458DRAFT_332874 [Lentithecium fluviatile CBS 122367]|uniref:Uncharacterized protein n=1 Tax=Lentithecium fluviatile CBS 122367 TaxID=1168545 RepID=A0A6G1JD95_9PLEO|nr:hypothetical protein K458DRAFT_332874 [Lentithecium fluviatile CBS 122367]